MRGVRQHLKLWGYIAAVLLAGSSTTAATELARPNAPVFNACAADMSRDSAHTATRLEAIGWSEVSGYPPALAKYERAREILVALECCYEDGSISAEEFALADEESAWLEEHGASLAYQVENYPSSIRIWEAPEGNGFVALYDTYGEWICAIFLAYWPSDIASFISADHGRRSETYGIDSVTFVYDDRGLREKLEFLELFPFIPTPGLYWADYVIADRQALSELSGKDFPLALTAEIGVAYRY